MLGLTLIFSAFLLIWTNSVAWEGTKAGHAKALGISGGFLCVALCFGEGALFHGALVIGAAVLCLAAFIKSSRPKPFLFLASSLAATVVCYGILSTIAIFYVLGWDKYREMYPFESLEGRLAYEKRPAPFIGKDGQDRRGQLKWNGRLKARVETIENELDERSKSHKYSQDGMRMQSLQHLHTSNVILFTESPGFGVSRQIGPSTFYLEPVPDRGAIPVTSSGDPDHQTSRTPPETFLEMHQKNLVDFVNPLSFGVIKDVQHVRGFESHQFRFDTPFRTPDRWQLRRLELLSLLKFDTPMVYVSESLPRMKDMGNAETRPLDAFEKSGLDALLAGEDLKVSESDNEIRMVGSLRAAKQCLACHGVERGDLLGAFSYRFGR